MKKNHSQFKHGHCGHGGIARTPTYNSWRKMKERCLNANELCYENYGGRGITFSTEWLSFNRFLEDMGERPLGTTLDRIDPYGNYEKTNCRWADATTHGRNKRK